MHAHRELHLMCLHQLPELVSLCVLFLPELVILSHQVSGPRRISAGEKLKPAIPAIETVLIVMSIQFLSKETSVARLDASLR